MTLSNSLQRLAEFSQSPPRPLVNAHVHLPPNFSAFADARQAVELAAEQGVRLLGTSNYYDYHVYAAFVDAARQRGVFPLLGNEIVSMMRDRQKAGERINDPANPGKAYVCGKGINRLEPMTSRAEEILSTIRKTDTERTERMTEALAGLFREAGHATSLTAEAISDAVAHRAGVDRSTVTLQERHLAQAFQEAAFEVAETDRPAFFERLYGGEAKADSNDALAVQGEIRSRLMKSGRPAYVAESFLSFEEAVEMILELGGVPSYPVLIDGASPICEFEASPARLVENLKALRINAAEFIPNRNEGKVLESYVRTMVDAGIVVTAGTEHNTNELIGVPPTCKDGPIPEFCQAAFWEGACVMVAHQSRMVRGGTGMVGRYGGLSHAFRRDLFRAEGEAMIRAFASEA